MVFQRVGLVLSGLLILALGMVAVQASAYETTGPPDDLFRDMFNATDNGNVLFSSGALAATHSSPAPGVIPEQTDPTPEQNAVIAAPDPTRPDSIGPHDSLQAAIDAAADGGTLYLDPGIYTEHDIIISKNIFICSNASAGGNRDNTIIDAQEQGRIFNVTGAFFVSLDNLSLRNATLDGGGSPIAEGGAIVAPAGSMLLITSVRFIDCTVTGGSQAGGGAVSSHGLLTVTSSSFEDCTAAGRAYGMGGAIWGMPTTTITSSSFTDCAATGPASMGLSWGGALCSVGTVTSSTFENCTATGYATSGGAIAYVGTVDASLFRNCSITGSAAGGNGLGGAIYSYGTVAVASSTFENCSATATHAGGGAIAGLNTTITGSSFTSCTATDPASGGFAYGGAVFAMNEGTHTLASSRFTGCTATGLYAIGGAIAALGSSIAVTSGTFTGCSANGGSMGSWGGAIAADGNATISSGTFTQCSATGTGSVGGGAIYLGSGDNTVSSTTFTGCSVSSGGIGFGGAILSGIGNVTVTSGTFTGCSASGAGYGGHGGAIMLSDSSGGIHFSRLYGNAATGNGTAICAGYGAVSAENNWWGTNSDPSPMVYGRVTTDPWLVLGITADPVSIDTSGTSTIRTNLTYNRTSGSQPAGDTSGMGHVPDRILNRFSRESGRGSVLPLTDRTVNGAAQTLFTPSYAETANISGTVDGETVYIGVPVAQGPPAPSGITPDTGVNTSAVAITNLAGSSFAIQGTTTVNLTRGGHANITATGVRVVDNTRITGTLPITGAEAGSWDVVVINPDGQEGVLPGGFTVTIPAPPAVPAPATPVPPYNPYEDRGTLSDFPSSLSAPNQTVTVNIGGDSRAWQAVVTGTGLRDLIVTGTVQAGPGDNRTAPPGTVYQYLGLVPARFTGITNAVIHFTVPQAWLDEHHIAPGSIVLYRQTAGAWEALPTTVLNTKDGTVYFSAQSRGFSLFAIAGTPGVMAPLTTTVPREMVSIPEPRQTPAPAAVAKEPVTTRTTAQPDTAPVPAKSPPLPLVPVLAVICCLGLIGGGWCARRWWIRRQNPALFAEDY